MGIQELPQATVRALGASQVLTDPASLVKELCDNAFDARATSIAIEITSNTLDVIQVRDNGHGIASEDRPMVARRYCTSKITDETDLASIGGSSLGFRGEALASVAELSGSLIISTRVEGEQVATALKINQQGEVISSDHASLPVGTTVRVVDFIKANPVRRQILLKNTEACLKKIKRNLQAFAFAKPYVRLSLRATKAKNDKFNWVYAPKASGNAEDVAFKVVGAACASQCTWAVLEESGFTFQGFLPRPDAAPSKMSGIGSFLSVDSRCVSGGRGTPKTLVKAFREALKRSNPDFSDVKDAFLFLDISCPRGSYDPNVEPAKDDVLFEDANTVVGIARKFFGTVYSRATILDAQEDAMTHGPGQMSAHEDQGEHAGIQIDDERPPGRVPINSTASSRRISGAPVDRPVSPLPEALNDDEPRSGGNRRAFRSNMYGCDDEDLELLDARPRSRGTEADFAELREASKDVNVSNPWVLARMNASSRRRPEGLKETHASSLPTYSARQAQMSSSPIKRTGPTIELETSHLPTPRPSSPSPPGENFHPSDHVPDLRIGRDGRVIGPPSLPAPQIYLPATPGLSFEPENRTHSADPRPANPDYIYGLASGVDQPPAGTPLAAIPDITRSRRSPKKNAGRTPVNKPFVMPAHDQSQPQRKKVWFDHLENIERLRHRRRQDPTASDGLVMQGDSGETSDDPRPLTPPRRNRDIREFVGRSGDDDVASFIERRNYHGIPQLDLTGDPRDEPVRAEAPRPPVNNRGHLSRDFVPASKLMDLEAHGKTLDKLIPRAPKRCKTSERRALQEISNNAPLPSGDAGEEDDRPATEKQAPSRSKSSNKPHRRTSSRLPLERTPAGQSVQNLILNTSISHQKLSSLAGKIDEEASLFGYNQPAMTEMYEGLAAAGSDVHALSSKLLQLLVATGCDTNGLEPETVLHALQEAFTQHAVSADDDEGDDMSI